MKKIGLFTKRFLDISETFIYEPLKLMRDFEVFVFALQRRKAQHFPYEKIFTVDQLPSFRQKLDLFLGDLGREFYLLDQLKRQKIELLHAHYGYMGIYALQYKQKLNIPLITNFYGVDVYQHSRSSFYRRQLKKLFSRGDLFLACSKKMREDLIALGAPASRTIVHYGGTDLAKFPLAFQPYQPGRNIDILMCGRFVEKKGFSYGLQAFLNAAKLNPQLRLKIIGGGAEENNLRALAASSPLRTQIQFLGEKNYAEYMQELKDCQIFMSPSVTAKSGDREGLPTVLIEAAALGKPLVATRHSGIPEIVHDGKNGYLAEERDVDGLTGALTKILENNFNWPEYARYGRALVEQEFDLRKQVSKVEKYYRDLL